jgi:hypothetical protein
MARTADGKKLRNSWSILGSALILGLTPFSPVRAGTSIEYAVKATFIYKFAPYVQWPPNQFASPADPMTICVVGSDAVAAQLDLLAPGQQVDGRPVAVHHLSVVSRDAGCDILYVADSDRQAVANDLNAVKGAPVLTVTDADRTPDITGIIAFTVIDRHVRFDVDDTTAAADGLTISSKLLNLAHAVKHRP